MNSIGVVGKPSRHRFKVIEKLENTQSTRVRVFSSLEEVRYWLKRDRLSGLVLVEEFFEDSHIELMDNISHEFPHLVVLALVSRVKQIQRQEFQRYQIPRCTLLDVNFELKDLRGVVQRMIRGEQVAMRAHYRYLVSKRAQLITRAGPTSRIHIVDISAGGLQARGGSQQIRIGECIQIKVPKDDGKGSYMIIGRVAWVSHKGHFGVKFDQVLNKSDSSRVFMQSA